MRYAIREGRKRLDVTMCMLSKLPSAYIVHRQRTNHAQEEVGLETVGGQPSGTVEQGAQPDELLHLALDFTRLGQVYRPLLSMFLDERGILCNYFSELLDKVCVCCVTQSVVFQNVGHDVECVHVTYLGHGRNASDTQRVQHQRRNAVCDVFDSARQTWSKEGREIRSPDTHIMNCRLREALKARLGLPSLCNT